jgi:hypothetical protein
MFETIFFLCPAMSQPLNSATPGRSLTVPFFGRERYVLCFYVKKIVPVDTLLHLLRVGLRKFFPVVLLCQFLVLAGK